jgi:hypothetical protein
MNSVCQHPYPIGSMYGIYANIGGILMVNVTIYSIHGSYGYLAWSKCQSLTHPIFITGHPTGEVGVFCRNNPNANISKVNNVDSLCPKIRHVFLDRS